MTSKENTESSASHGHFGGKEALEHVVEKQGAGVESMAESHGAETPGHISSLADSARESAFFLLLIGSILQHLPHPPSDILTILVLASLGLLVWKTGRSAWLGWTRIERLHRLVEQEKWEIQHQRPQEREELYALYQPKGFEGPLLEEVVDVLMADDNRLLKVMLEEEMGLCLECQEHPLKQALGAFLGAFGAFSLCLLGYYLAAFQGLFCSSLLSIALGSRLSAVYEKNETIPAIIWNLGIALLAFSTAYFTLAFLRQGS